VATPERRVLEPVFVIEHAFVSRAVGRLSGQNIKDAVQGLIDPGAQVSRRSGRGGSAATRRLTHQLNDARLPNKST
jgi:hypothetical protein